MLRLAATACALLLAALAVAPVAPRAHGLAGGDPQARERVVLLHGLARTPRSMRPLAAVLERAGFAVHNLGYPSRSRTPDELLAHVGDEIARCCADGERPLHFVAHSLGGILVRAYLESHEAPQLGRVVMIAPPNRGTRWVGALGRNPIFAVLLGPTAQLLGTGADSLPNRLGPARYELGVIAGSLDPLRPWRDPAAGDGLVAIESTRLEGMDDFLVLHETHVSIKRDPRAAAAVVHFLRHGRFGGGEHE